MSEQLAPISIARQLNQHDLFYFTPALLANFLGLDRRPTYRLIDRLQAEGLAAEVERGKFLLLGLEPERVLANPFFIASHLVTPGYVSYWSALHFYGFTEQVPLTTFVATTKKKRPVVFQTFRFRFVTIKPPKFFGYRQETLGDLPMLVADEAKAIVDCLDQPRYAGGVAEVAKTLRAALDTVNIATLVDYANRMGDRSLGSRLGYLLETLGHHVDGLIRSASPVKLDPTRPQAGRRVAHWQVMVNLPETELFPEGVG